MKNAAPFSDFASTTGRALFGLSLLTTHTAVAQSEEAPQAPLTEAVALYSAAQNYWDSGVVTTTFHSADGSERTLTQRFRTAFDRASGHFRLEFQDEGVTSAGSQYVILDDGSETRVWWELKGAVEPAPDLKQALMGASFLSSGLTDLAPPLLIDGVARAEPLGSLTPNGEPSSDGESVTVHGLWNGRETSVTINSETGHLASVHQASEFAGMETRRDVVFHEVAIDTDLPSEAFAFVEGAPSWDWSPLVAADPVVADVASEPEPAEEPLTEIAAEGDEALATTEASEEPTENAAVVTLEIESGQASAETDSLDEVPLVVSEDSDVAILTPVETASDLVAAATEEASIDENPTETPEVLETEPVVDVAVELTTETTEEVLDSEDLEPAVVEALVETGDSSDEGLEVATAVADTDVEEPAAIDAEEDLTEEPVLAEATSPEEEILSLEAAAPIGSEFLTALDRILSNERLDRIAATLEEFAARFLDLEEQAQTENVPVIGRFQLGTYGPFGAALVIDTVTGQVWEMGSESSLSDAFLAPKIPDPSPYGAERLTRMPADPSPELADKTPCPSFFSCDSGSASGVWLRVDQETWLRRRKGAIDQRYRVSHRVAVEESLGTVVMSEPTANADTQAEVLFIPDLAEEPGILLSLTNSSGSPAWTPAGVIGHME